MRRTVINVTDDNEFVTAQRCPFPQSLSRDALFTGLNPLSSG